jgi:hypothetical protein
VRQQEAVVVSAARHHELLWLRSGVEQASAVLNGDDLVVGAVEEEHRRASLSNPLPG